jgi:hypothetical protein
MSGTGIYDAFTVISLVAFCALIVLGGWLASQTGHRWLPAAVVLLLTTSPLAVYAGWLFGVGLASFLLVLAVAAALRRWVLALCVLLACIALDRPRRARR